MRNFKCPIYVEVLLLTSVGTVNEIEQSSFLLSEREIKLTAIDNSKIILEIYFPNFKV